MESKLTQRCERRMNLIESSGFWFQFVSVCVFAWRVLVCEYSPEYYVAPCSRVSIRIAVTHGRSIESWILMRVYTDILIHTFMYSIIAASVIALPVCHYGIFSVNTAINHVDSGIVKTKWFRLVTRENDSFFLSFSVNRAKAREQQLTPATANPSQNRAKIMRTLSNLS